MRVRMNVSIASAKFSYQPGEIVDLPDDSQTRAWIQNGHAERVSPKTPLTERDLNLRDLDADEARTRVCSNCERRRGQVAFRWKSLCARCYRAELES